VVTARIVRGTANPSLAEAVASVNQGSPAYNCSDAAPGSAALITLIEAAGKSYANNHYVIGTLTLNRSVRIQPSEEGFRAYIDSTGAFAFKVASGATVDFYGLNIAHTGGGSGRVIWNEGSLSMTVSTVKGGNVTTEPLGIGGGIYNKGTLYLGTCTIQNNSGKKGAGIYNDSGQIPNLSDTVITQNTATLAGGGIYNVWSTPVEGAVPPNIQGSNTTITYNSAKAGGGIFNRGIIDLYASNIGHNTVSGTGSGETCGSGQSCDGAGGGVLTVAYASNTYARVNFQSGTKVEYNTASGRGGGFYSAGQLNAGDIRIENNRASDGAAIYGAFSGTNTYCSVEVGASSIVGNFTSPAGAGHYSIIDITSDSPHCFFAGVTASGNSNPRCGPNSATPGCPQ